MKSRRSWPRAYVMCRPSIGEVWREESFGSPSSLASSIALPTVAAVEVLREMWKLDREWIGWSYLSMARDISLAPPSSLSHPLCHGGLPPSISAMRTKLPVFFRFPSHLHYRVTTPRKWLCVFGGQRMPVRGAPEGEPRGPWQAPKKRLCKKNRKLDFIL